CVTTTCTRSDVLKGGSSYPPIIVTVNVASNATSPQVNQAAVSGGGSVSANTTDPTTLVPAGTPPSLRIAKTHSGNFAQGQQNAKATSPQVNQAAVAGGGSPGANTTDSTSITIPGTLSVNRARLNFGFSVTQLTSTQTVVVSFRNGVGANWTVSSNQPNITVF